MLPESGLRLQSPRQSLTTLQSTQAEACWALLPPLATQLSDSTTLALALSPGGAVLRDSGSVLASDEGCRLLARVVRGLGVRGEGQPASSALTSQFSASCVSVDL